MAQSFLHGTVILVGASLFNRLVGFVYQILLIRIIRPEGVGLFSMIFPIYILALVLSTMGIPSALARLVAEEVAHDNPAGAYRIFRIALVYLVLFGSFFTAFLLFLSFTLIRHILPNPAAGLSLITLAPAIIIVAVCSGFRGLFQGLQQMGPTAASQAVEQLTRFFIGLALAGLLLPRGLKFATAGVSAGVVAGELAGFAVMVYLYRHHRPRLVPQPVHRRESLGSVSRRLFALGIPITLTRAVSTALYSVETILIPQRLVAAGLTVDKATALYGQLAGIAESLLYTPSIVTMALATALLPAISDALAQKNYQLVRSRTQEAFRLTILVGLPAVVFFLVLPRQLCGIVFGYAGASDALLIMATGGIFLYLSQTCTGVLQGMGRPLLPFKNAVISSAIRIAGIYFLTARPHLNIMGAAAALTLDYIFTACLNMADLRKVTGLTLDFREILLKPAFCAGIMGLIIFTVKSFFFARPAAPGLSLAAVLLLGCLVYGLILLGNGTIDKGDLSRIAGIFRNFT